MKWGRVFAGAVGSGAGALSALASKYIDEELTQQRAQALADIQRESSLRTERELDAQRNTPERLERDRETARQGVLAKASAEREAVTAGVNDPAYQGARDTETLMEARRRARGEVEVIEGTKGARLTAEQERIKALLPYEKEREQALNDIRVNGQIRASNASIDGQIRRLEAAADRAAAKRIGPDGKPIKLSEASTLELKNIAEQEQALQKLVDENIASGMLKQDPGDKGWQHFQRRTQALQVQKLRVYAREGLIDGEAAAQDLIAAGASSAELDASVKQAGLIGGQYAKDFAAAVSSAKRQPERSTASPAPARSLQRESSAASNADPLSGLSRSQIREKRDDLMQERRRWADNPAASARLAEIDELLDRINSGRY